MLAREHFFHKTVTAHVLGGLLAAALVLGASEWVSSLMLANKLEQQRSATLSQLATLRARLEGEINSSLYLTRGLMAYVAIHPEVDVTEFSQLASEIVFVGRNIRNIALARDNVITYVYPLAGNEAALGLDYRKVPDQWSSVRRAIDSNQIVVSGPTDLVQGGRGLIARIPIYTRPGVSGALDEGRPKFWGIAAIVIDIPRLFAAAGLDAVSDDFDVALRGKDALGAAGAMIYGEKALFDRMPLLQTVTLPNGNWQIAALPSAGWADNDDVWLPRLLGAVFALLVGGLMGALLWARAENRNLALHDHLTGLPNRRLLEDRFEQMVAFSERDQRDFEVLYVDLDSFKQVNDRFGHKVGDALLIEVARRMQSSIRAMDAVARIGGDEFIVLTTRLNAKGEGEIHRRLQEVLAGIVFIEGHELEIEASIGRAVFPHDGRTIDHLLTTADRAMYQRKQSGKVRQVDFR